ncbi:hypothetical protein [Ponticaulis sp.]|uniref:hypothetical protein n=1 Tax=Ponticaulis sp. TaxID=2020902 RepID=UPI0026152BA8|nr:hypothetical protein [Ponticaulis sp.]MDF1680157.1 hypothetical protein [Ponticaulis sp.]
MRDVLKTLAVLASCAAVTLSSGAAFAQYNPKPVPDEDNLIIDRTSPYLEQTNRNFGIILQPTDDLAYEQVDPYGYRVVIDCDVAGVENEGTSSVYVSFYEGVANRSQILYSELHSFTDERCNEGEIEIPVRLRTPIASVLMYSQTSDAFLVDRVRVFGPDGLLQQWGEDDDKGVCVSRDLEDGSRTWRYAADDRCELFFIGNPGQSSSTFYEEPLETVYRYSVDIDCDVTGVENEGTGNQLMISYLNAQGETLGTSWFHEDTNAPILPICRDMEEETLVRGIPTTLEIRTTGSDAALLDQIYVYRDGVEVKVIGESNSSGWCLSTDRGDANGNWRGHIFQGQCSTIWQFDLR